MKKEKITIEYARKKLGKKAERMTDAEINDLIHTLQALCKRAIDSAINKGDKRSV